MRNILLAILMILMFVVASSFDFDTEVREGGAMMDNGNRIETAVVEDVTDDVVTVKLGRHLYSFYGDTFKEGEVICVEITSHDEIINAW